MMTIAKYVDMPNRSSRRKVFDFGDFGGGEDGWFIVHLAGILLWQPTVWQMVRAAVH
jgi:hypothetical protein